MSFTLTPGNVQGGIVTAIALADPAAAFTSGSEVGMKNNGTYTADPVLVPMSSDNDWTDLHKVLIEYDQLQNRIADVGALWTKAQTGTQAIIKTSSGDYGIFTGQTWDSETLLGLEFDWQFSQGESFIKTRLMGEVGDATLKSLWGTTAGSHVWTAGAAIANRKRMGIKSITIGGANIGLLRSAGGNIKSRSGMVQGGRPIGQGIEANIKAVMAQTAQADHDAAIDAQNDDDTVIVDFWNGQSIKLTNLFAGKAAKLTFSKEHSIELNIKAYFPEGTTRIDYTTDADVLDLTMLDNEAQA